MKTPFDARNVTLQLKDDPKGQWGTQSIPFYYFQEAFDSRRVLKPFFYCARMSTFIFSANKAMSEMQRFL